jgi:opacity protein-like surface antigen
VDGHAMLYLKAGGVSARYSTGVVFTPSPLSLVTLNTTTTKTLSGWAAGGGVEYGIDMHWSVRAEYLVLGLARNVTNCGTPLNGFIGPGQMCTVTHTPDVQTITVGLNYRFH